MTIYKLSAPLPAPRQASACCIMGGKGGLMFDLETPLFTREAPRMTVSPGNLNMVEKSRNFSADDCFHSRSTVLQGQPFGGIPTVLFLNVILWVVSSGQCSGQTERPHPGWMVQLSQMRQGAPAVRGCQPQWWELSECQSCPGRPRVGGPWRRGGCRSSGIPDSLPCTLVQRSAWPVPLSLPSVP